MFNIILSEESTLNEFLQYRLFQLGDFSMNVEKLVSVVIILILTKLILLGIRKSIYRTRKNKTRDPGSLYSVVQIVNYFGWILAIIIILDVLGIKLTMLLTGGAALLVGVGLGLQQTFNDFISGVILLIEGKTKVGDVLQIDDDVVMLKEIGLRTSEGVNRDLISVIIPNSKIINDKVINWSHQEKKTRFRIKVGVAYGSDVDKVVKILEDSVMEHPDITDRESVEARFIDFGNSSLDFELLFFSQNIFRIEKVKSDIRKIISRNFAANGINIPFPQMDIYVKEFNKKQEAKSESL